MKIHPLMLAAAIAFWGGQTGQWLVAVAVAAILCASFYVSLRWALDTAQLYRVTDFCIVLALLLGGYLYVSYGNPRAVILFFQWLPVVLLPVALAHAYGTAERMDPSVLFWSLRRRPSAKPRGFDPWFACFAMWIVAASAANGRGEWFYLGLVVLVGWPLVRIRPWSYRVGSWGIAFSMAIGLGYGLQYGLNSAQAWLEEAVPEWISSDGSRTDPYRATTDIGHIGQLKDSDTIVLRVVVPDGAKPPPLLHRASYNVYFGKAWIARGAEFVRLEGGQSSHLANDRWPLAAEHGPAARATIYDYTVRPNPVLSLPAGTAVIEGLQAVSAQRNPLGTVQIVREPGFFSYVAAYAGTEAFDGAPTAEDLKLPAKERDAFAALATALGLSGQTPSASVARVEAHFADGYRYSTFQKNAPFSASPIIDFLLRSKSGHCEYFATATVLLLRAGGIPARYATGFAIAEKSPLENAYIARLRHSHAWVRAYVDGAWIEIDTTPPAWFDIEAEESGPWSAVADRWSWLRFRAARMWAGSDSRTMLGGALTVVLPFALWLAWRLYRSRRTTMAILPTKNAKSLRMAGADSEYYRVEQHLRERGRGRHQSDTAQDWLARLNADAQMDIDMACLAEIVELHNRFRFDPIGLTQAERMRLREMAEQWLARQVAQTV
jgi:transglutaminase-like putative cysteine protease